MKMPESNDISRRTFITTTGVATTGLLSGFAVGGGAYAEEPGSPWDLSSLSYAYDALEPVIDARTMEIHHSRHHAAYVNNVKRSLEPYSDLAGQPVEQTLSMIPALPAEIQTSVRNNGGGHWNHALFWAVMSPDGGGSPSGALAAAIEHAFGDLMTMKTQFNRAAATQFGSGWAWLSVSPAGELFVSQTPNQDNPLMEGLVDKVGLPILGLDVWEHAYYLQYQYRRGDYIAAWWDVVNWPRVEALYDEAMERL